MKLWVKILSIFFLFLFIFVPKNIEARSGCCSWHQGVCGCRCCDGTPLSATCAPYYPSCNNGGYGQESLLDSLTKPQNPTNGNWTYSMSSDNWCNYDVIINWSKPTHGDRFSINISKYAGGNPGPLADTFSTNYTFKNITPGEWYINIKTGDGQRWSNVSYWTVTLPKPIPKITAYISQENNNQYLFYDISCLKKVNGPEEFINNLTKKGNLPKDKVLLNYENSKTFEIKGWDFNNKEYSYTLFYTPIKKINKKVEENCFLWWCW